MKIYLAQTKNHFRAFTNKEKAVEVVKEDIIVKWDEIIEWYSDKRTVLEAIEEFLETNWIEVVDYDLETFKWGVFELEVEDKKMTEIMIMELAEDEVKMVMKERKRKENIAHQEEVLEAFRSAKALADKYNIHLRKRSGVYIYASDAPVNTFEKYGDNEILIN